MTEPRELSLAIDAAERKRLATLERENEQLRVALVSRVVIEQAKGVLAERLWLSIEEAFALLRRAARSNRRRIHTLAAEVVSSRETPAEIADLVPLFRRLNASARFPNGYLSSAERQSLRGPAIGAVNDARP